jgi:hypothetical protein
MVPIGPTFHHEFDIVASDPGIGVVLPILQLRRPHVALYFDDVVEFTANYSIVLLFPVSNLSGDATQFPASFLIDLSGKGLLGGFTCLNVTTNDVLDPR